MHHLDTLFSPYNLRDDHAKESFAAGVRNWAQFISDEISDRAPTSVICDLKIILDKAWQQTRIRCQLTELLAKEASLGSDQENAAWCQGLEKIIRTIRFVFHPSSAGNPGLGLLSEMGKQCYGAERRLLILRSEAPYSPDPDDRFGWRDYPVTTGMPLVIYDHLKIQIASTPEKETGVLRSKLLSGQKVAYDELRLMLRARRERLTAGGIKPRLHGLVIGPSGSGKSKSRIELWREAYSHPHRRRKEDIIQHLGISHQLTPVKFQQVSIKPRHHKRMLITNQHIKPGITYQVVELPGQSPQFFVFDRVGEYLGEAKLELAGTPERRQTEARNRQEQLRVRTRDDEGRARAARYFKDRIDSAPLAPEESAPIIPAPRTRKSVGTSEAIKAPPIPKVISEPGPQVPVLRSFVIPDMGVSSKIAVPV